MRGSDQSQFLAIDKLSINSPNYNLNVKSVIVHIGQSSIGLCIQYWLYLIRKRFVLIICAEYKMSQTTMTVRLNNELSDFATKNVGENGSFENMSEYIRSLIRDDKERYEKKVFNRLKMELELAFSVPDEHYSQLRASDIIERN